MTTNDAAERLRAGIKNQAFPFTAEEAWLADLDAALAAERRATVERIRAGIEERWMAHNGHINRAAIDAILDAEAER